MDEVNTNVDNVQDMDNSQLKDAISGTLEKIRTQALLLGAQSVCSVILQKINDFEHKNSKITMNDHKRLVKDIKQFCQTGVSRKVNFDGTTSVSTEEEQNNTKLLQEE